MDQYPLFMIQLHLQKKQVSHLFHTIFFMFICESPLLFHRREGRGEQSSLACKEICTKMSRCEQSCFWQGKKGVVIHDNWEYFKKTLKNHTGGKWSFDVPFEAQPPQNQTNFKIILRLNIILKSYQEIV